MKKFLLLLLLLFLISYITSCGNYSTMQKRKYFELHNHNPIAKNLRPSSMFFKQEKKDISTNLTSKKRKKYKTKNTSMAKSTKKNTLTSSATAKTKAPKTKNKSNNSKKLANSKRKALVKYAKSFDKHKRVKKNKKFLNDCSGFVRSVYDKFNIELYDTKRNKKNGKWLNGTNVIYNFVQENGEIFKNKLPVMGDIIFFDNTTDRNRDGKVNDKFTHIAIVINVKSNGTVYYIHKSNRGINIQKLNLKYPNKVYIKVNNKKIKVNSYLRKRRKKDKKNTPYLSSQMFRAYGSIFKSENFVKLMK